jgi:hypothetical protein
VTLVTCVKRSAPNDVRLCAYGGPAGSFVRRLCVFGLTTSLDGLKNSLGFTPSAAKLAASASAATMLIIGNPPLCQFSRPYCIVKQRSRRLEW